MLSWAFKIAFVRGFNLVPNLALATLGRDRSEAKRT